MGSVGLERQTISAEHSVHYRDDFVSELFAEYLGCWRSCDACWHSLFDRDADPRILQQSESFDHRCSQTVWDRQIDSTATNPSGRMVQPAVDLEQCCLTATPSRPASISDRDSHDRTEAGDNVISVQGVQGVHRVCSASTFSPGPQISSLCSSVNCMPLTECRENAGNSKGETDKNSHASSPCPGRLGVRRPCIVGEGLQRSTLVSFHRPPLAPCPAHPTCNDMPQAGSVSGISGRHIFAGPSEGGFPEVDHAANVSPNASAQARYQFPMRKGRDLTGRRPRKRVRFDFTVSFWFPAPHQLARHACSYQALEDHGHCSQEVAETRHLAPPQDAKPSAEPLWKLPTAPTNTDDPVALRRPEMTSSHCGSTACISATDVDTGHEDIRPGPSTGAHSAAATPDQPTWQHLAVFDVVYHVRVMSTDVPYTLPGLIGAALQACQHLEPPLAFRVIRHRLDGLPDTQIVVWSEPNYGHRVLPVRYGPAAEDICTVNLLGFATPLDLAACVSNTCHAATHLYAQAVRGEVVLAADGLLLAPVTPYQLAVADQCTVAPGQWALGRHLAATLVQEVNPLHLTQHDIDGIGTNVVVHRHRHAPVSICIRDHFAPSQMLSRIQEALNVPGTSRMSFPSIMPYSSPCQIQVVLHVGMQHFLEPLRCLADLRRLGRVPSQQMSVVELPATCDIHAIRRALARQHPTLDRVSGAFLNYEQADDRATAVHKHTVLTVMGPVPHPDLDVVLPDGTYMPKCYRKCAVLATRSGLARFLAPTMAFPQPTTTTTTASWAADATATAAPSPLRAHGPRVECSPEGGFPGSSSLKRHGLQSESINTSILPPPRVQDQREHRITARLRVTSGSFCMAKNLTGIPVTVDTGPADPLGDDADRPAAISPSGTSTASAGISATDVTSTAHTIAGGDALVTTQAALPVDDAGRFTVMGTSEGVTNKAKPPEGGDEACVQEALATAPRTGPHLDGKALSRPLPGLYCPQVLLTRVAPSRGWVTIAVDLRALHLGVKIVEVPIGSTPRTSLQGQAPLAVELSYMGRDNIVVSCLVDLQTPSCDERFTAATESLTLIPSAHSDASTIRVTTSVDHPALREGHSTMRWGRRGREPPSGQASDDDLAGGTVREQTAFTVFDTIHHMRVMVAPAKATFQDFLAIALSLTPELHTATGVFLAHAAGGLPVPQLALVERPEDHCLVPVQWRDEPARFCTVEVPQGSTAFQILYGASHACPSLRGAHQQLAKGTAAIYTNAGVVPPFAQQCVSGHEVVQLRGFRSRSNPATAAELDAAGFPRWLPSRTLTGLEEEEAAALSPVMVVGTRCLTASVMIGTLCTPAQGKSTIAAATRGSLGEPCLTTAQPPC